MKLTVEEITSRLQRAETSPKTYSMGETVKFLQDCIPLFEESEQKISQRERDGMHQNGPFTPYKLSERDHEYWMTRIKTAYEHPEEKKKNNREVQLWEIWRIMDIVECNIDTVKFFLDHHFEYCFRKPTPEDDVFTIVDIILLWLLFDHYSRMRVDVDNGNYRGA